MNDGTAPTEDQGTAADLGGHRGPTRLAAVLRVAERVCADPSGRIALWVTSGSVLFLIFTRILFPSPNAILFQGAVLGALSALIAVGLILIYRASQIINFAQGDLGAVAGVLAVSLIVGWQWSFWPAVIAGLLVGVLLGVAIEFLIIRRFAHAPRLILTVATLGLAQLLSVLQLVVPTWFGYNVAPQNFPTPFDASFTWPPAVFRGGHLLVLVVTPVVVLGLGYFFVRTRTGKAVRAVAESRDRALMLGIPVPRIGTYVWALAALLSSLAALMRAPIVGVPIGQTLGPSLMLRALAAAVIGRMENLRVTVAAGIGIGIIEQAVLWHTGRTLFVEPVLFGVVLIALVARSGGVVSRGVARAQSSFSAIREVRPIPPELRQDPRVRRAARGLKLVGGALLVLLPLGLTPGRVNLLSLGLITGILALSLVVLTGWAGQISLGQWAFAGFGAAICGAMVLSGWNPLLAIAAGGLVGAVVSVVVGAPALRIHGLFLAVATLSFSLATGSYFVNPEMFGYVPGPNERILRGVILGRWDLESERVFYYLCLSLLALVLLSMRSLRGSRPGRVLLAVRENEAAAQSFGINLVRAKLTAFAYSGFVAALAGALLVLHQHTMLTTQLAPEENLRLFTIAVVGGLATPFGVLLSTAVFTGIDFFTSSPWIQLLTTGAGLLFVLMALPGGLGGIVYSVRDRILRAYGAAAGIHVPSLIADSRVDDTGAAVTRVRQTSSPIDVDALLSVRDVEVSYGQTQVLFGVDVDVAPGEIVALLGTNGAGKSTLLNAICGLTPSSGRIVFDGEDISDMPAQNAITKGIVMVPGGKGVFPTLTVGENLELAAWTLADRPDHVETMTERVLEFFPRLRERWDERAGDLSGGEQQMLTLGQAFIAEPKLLMIDELSLGLAPVIVEQLLEIVRAIHRNGTTVVLVEQSVNVACTIADRAVFMEKGEVRFDGRTADLLERGDVLRAVFLEGTAVASGEEDHTGATTSFTMPTLSSLNGAAHRTAVGRVLHTDGLSVDFGGIRAVDRVDLTVDAAEIVGVIGPNGAGKTTLMDLISGMIAPTEGSVEFLGVDVTRVPADRRAWSGLGRSFQDARLFPALTVSETIAVAFERHVATRDPIAAALASPATRSAERSVAARVDELVDLLGLGAFANKFVSELSTGTRRIVDIACSLAHSPSLLLLDEPSSGIAQRETEALGPVITGIRDQTHTAIIVIEHDMPLITAVADRLVALESGAVIVDGEPGEVVSHPRVVAAYLGGSEKIIARSGPGGKSAGAPNGTPNGGRRRRPLKAEASR